MIVCRNMNEARYDIGGDGIFGAAFGDIKGSEWGKRVGPVPAVRGVLGMVKV